MTPKPTPQNQIKLLGKFERVDGKEERIFGLLLMSERVLLSRSRRGGAFCVMFGCPL